MKPIYVLGTGLSQNGSACLLKNGKIAVAIEKERITRRKHDGFNDTLAIEYCLRAEGIELKDVDLVVQNANYGSFEYGNDYFGGGYRPFANNPDVPVVTISHHLAHGYYALGTCPFEETAILVIDGCGSLMDEVIDIQENTFVPENVPLGLRHLYAEKDSYYYYGSEGFKSLWKDFSPFGMGLKGYPMHPDATMHSIGGIYGVATNYCFDDSSDPGKLMGLAPYGHPNIYDHEVFELRDGRVFVRYDWMKHFRRPVLLYKNVFEHFQYYADIARWIQREAEKAILYVVNARHDFFKSDNLVYSGGVALNAVANARIVREGRFRNVYFTPAAGDNGLAIGCAYFGWLEILKKQRVLHSGRSNFGIPYESDKIRELLSSFIVPSQGGDAVEKLLTVISHQSVTDNELPYTIQFVIPDRGFYALLFKDGICEYVNSPVGSPHCIIATNAITFLKVINDPGRLMWDPTIHIEGDAARFFEIVDLKRAAHHFLATESENTKGETFVWSKENDVATVAAQLLTEGKVLGWFQGGCEFGPRALGFRSIIADPRRAGVRDFINANIKFREEFRPFAPSVLREDVSEYFEYDEESPYMLEVVKVREQWRNTLSSVMHLDNTSRIQTVTREWNPVYYDLINSFKKLTGLSVILNTSLNKKGMPIVETPEQALNFFSECDLDALVLENYIIIKPQAANHCALWKNQASVDKAY